MYVLVQYVLYVGMYMDWIGLVPGGDMAILWFASLQKVLYFIARLLTAPTVLTYNEHRMVIQEKRGNFYRMAIGFL